MFPWIAPDIQISRLNTCIISLLCPAAADDGLFARRDIPPGQLIASYAGFHIRNAEAEIYAGNMTKAERENAHKNLIHLDTGTDLDIPPRYSDIVQYRASLGHKVRTYYKVYMAQGKSSSSGSGGHEIISRLGKYVIYSLSCFLSIQLQYTTGYTHAYS